MPKAYHFKDWDELYENNKSREIETLSYFSQPNKLVGEGLGFLRQEPDWLELYGVLGFLKILASQSRKKFRGWLVKSESPLDAARVSALTGIPKDKVQRALDFFSTPPMDWLECSDLPGSHRTPSADVVPASGRAGAVPVPCGGGADVVPASGRAGAQLFAGVLTDRRMTDEEEREREKELRGIQTQQFAAIGARIQELQAVPEEDRTEEQEAELKKMRARRRKIQKKQAANDFTPLNEHD